MRQGYGDGSVPRYTTTFIPRLSLVRAVCTERVSSLTGYAGVDQSWSRFVHAGCQSRAFLYRCRGVVPGNGLPASASKSARLVGPNGWHSALSGP